VFSLCIASLSPLRSEPRHTAEMSSQILFGEPVWIREDLGDWVRLETAGFYQGFARKAHFEAGPLRHLPEGPVFRCTNATTRVWRGLHIPVPEGGLCWPVEGGNPDPARWSELPAHPGFHPERLVSDGMALCGIPYVWGGKTRWGMDCSGLVQFLLESQGFSFPRDAWQQEEMGEKLEGMAAEAALPGDLYFFQEPRKKVHHVAIALGDGRFLHASEWVRIESLRPQDRDFAPARLETFHSVRRLGRGSLKSLRTAFMNMIPPENGV
jgi:hypothetical protein